MRLAFLFILTLCIVEGSSTEITGRNKAYAGRTLQFYRYTDPVTLEKTPAFTIVIDATGTFSTSADIRNTIFTFCEFGIYRGNLFLEPDTEVELLLPPLREKTFAEEKNPYYTPVEFWFATGQGSNLNDRISALETQINTQTGKYFNQLYYNQSRSAYDSIQIHLQDLHPEQQPVSYSLHKEWRLKRIEADAFRLPGKSLSAELNDAGKYAWTHPAFIQLFEKAYGGKLSYEVKANGNESLPGAIASGDIGYLASFVEQEYGTTGALTSVALLKMLHDAFYSGEFGRERIISLINSNYFSENKNRDIITIAKNVIRKLTHLRKGTRAPEICLKDINGNRMCTGEDNKKYKYLLFADTEIAVVREQLKYLSRIEELFGKHLELYVILHKTDLIEMKQFLIEAKISGIHLVDEEGKFTEAYKVKTFPTAFLLNSRHEVIFEEAKTPLDGFEQQFGPFLRKELFLQQRNQPR